MFVFPEPSFHSRKIDGKERMFSPNDNSAMRSVLLGSLFSGGINVIGLNHNGEARSLIRNLLTEELDSEDLSSKDGLSSNDLQQILHLTNSHKPSHLRKRSTYKHLRRCIYILRTPCCRRYANRPLYIGKP